MTRPRYLRPSPGSKRVTIAMGNDLYEALVNLAAAHNLTRSGIACKLLRSHPEINLPPIE
jgi:hypothetical protein